MRLSVDQAALLEQLRVHLPLLGRLRASSDLSMQELAAGKQDPSIVTTSDPQTVTAQKTFSNAAVRVVDSNGTLIHSFGAST